MSAYHIAMVIARYPPVIGGTERQCQELSRTLLRQGHHVSVITERYDPDLAEFENQDGISIYRLDVAGSWWQSSYRFAQGLWKWLKEHPETDVIHAHMLAGPAMAALLLGKLLKKPVIIKTAGAGATGDIGTSSQLRRGRMKLAAFKRWAQWVVCPSTKTFDEVVALGLPTKRLRQIPNGVDAHRFHPGTAAEKEQLRVSYRIPFSVPVAVYAGRWAPGKGVEALLSVFELYRSQPHFHWRLCLLLSQTPTPEQQTRLESLKDRVRVYVGVTDPLPYYQLSDLAILLSDNEGISNFLLEAMACGLPLLTSPGAAVASPEESERWGWQKESHDAPAICALLQSLNPEQPVLAAKGRQARQKVETTFASDVVAQTYLQLYEDALKDF